MIFMRYFNGTILLFYSLFMIQSHVHGQQSNTVLNEQKTNAEPPHAHYIHEDGRYQSIKFSKSLTLPGIYSYAFEFQTEWTGSQVFVKLSEIKSPYSFRINGFTFGHGGDFGGIAEFNVTPFLKKGPNEIGVVFDDPENRHNEIPSHAIVMVYRDLVHIRDIQVSSYPEPTSGEVLVRLNLFVQSYLSDRNKGRLLTAVITDPQGVKVGSWKQKLDYPLAFRQEVEIALDQKIKNPMLWSPDQPDLYTLQLHMEEKGNQKEELIKTSFGIRNAMIIDSLLVINQDTIVPEVADWTLLEQTATRLKGESTEVLNEISIDPFNHPLSEYIVDQIQSGDYNAVLANQPIPSSMMELFDHLGIIVIKKESSRVPQTERPDINRACVIWTD